MSPVELYERVVLPRLTPDDIYRGINWRYERGRHRRGPCPLHGGTGPNFAVDTEALSWRCFSECQAGGGPIQYLDRVNGGDGRPRGSRFRDLVHELANRASIDPNAPPIPLSKRPRLPPTPTYPPSLEVDLFWARCVPVVSDQEVAKQLARRRLDAASLTSLDVVRLVPAGLQEAPRWSGHVDGAAWKSWASTGLRLVVPLYDAAGRMRAFRFRRVATSGAQEMKAAPCTRFCARGLVMADSAALQMLRTGAVPEWWADGDEQPFSVVIAEGETDFLSFASRAAEQDYATLRYPAVVGIVSGSITVEIFSRIPDGTRIISAVDHDGAGQHYHAAITTALHERWCEGDVSIDRWDGGGDARR